MTTSPERWLHLEGLKYDPWVLPIWSAAMTAADEGRLPPLPSNLRAVGVHASTRLSMVPIAVARVRKGVGLVWKAIASRHPEDEFSPGRVGRAFPVPGEVLPRLMLDVDSVLFELNSACDLTKDLYGGLHKHVGNTIDKDQVGPSVRKCLESAGAPTRWFGALDLHRNIFMHEAAPYLIVEISSSGSTGHDVLVMRHATNDLTDSSRYLRLSTLDQVVRDFRSAMVVLQQHLVALLSSAGTVSESR